MAQYWTDFSQYSNGTGVPSGWVARWDTNWGFFNSGIVIDDGGKYGGKVLRLTPPTDAPRALSWGAPGTNVFGTVEIMAELRFTSPLSTLKGVNALGILVRGGGSSGSERVYGHGYGRDSNEGGAGAVWKYLDGAGAWVLGPVSITVVRNRWMRLRLRVSGSTIRHKIWRGDQGEPASWLGTGSDSSLSVGWVGVFSFPGGLTSEYDWFSVGTGGDPALAPEDVFSSGQGPLIAGKRNVLLASTA